MLLLSALGPAQAAPYRPAEDAEVLLRGLPPPPAPVVERTPQAAAALAQGFIERARLEGDPRWLGYAQGVLQPWWTQTLPPPEVLLLRATLLQSRHRFAEALQDLDRLLEQQPRQAQAWLTGATLLRVLGRYDEAQQACRQLVGLVDHAVPALCAASLRGLTGELPAAREQLAALGPLMARQDLSLQAWYWAEWTEALERSGDIAAAEAAYTAALAAVPADLGLRAAYADFLLDQHQPDAVLRLLARPGDENVDALQLRRVLAQAALGRVDATLRARLADGFAAALRRGDGRHLREEARFALLVEGDAPRALELALENWQTQREPADTRLVYTATLAAGRPQAAEPVRTWMAENHYQDARLPQLKP